MPTLYPLRFHPRFRRYLWGGRRLQTVLHKSIGPGDDFAESWEVVDHGDDQSVVAFGPLEGTPLTAIVRQMPTELFGRGEHAKRFPLLFKFLDAHRNLSVQVHPTDEQAKRLDPPDLGKTEAWVIVDTEPGARIYAGLKPGIDRSALITAIRRDETESCLHVIHPRQGDCVFIPAGVVHALGAGLVVAEIQQSSDTTYRLFDWNRTGADGKPRQLHVDEALETIDYDYGPVKPQMLREGDSSEPHRLVECDKFVLDRWHVDHTIQVPADDHFHIVAVLEGAIQVEGEPSEQWLPKGQTVLLPASRGPTSLRVSEPTVLLDMHVPTIR